MEKLFKAHSTLCIVAGAAMWGLIGIFVRVLTSYSLGTLEIMSLRCIFAAVVLFIYLAVSDRKNLKVRPRDLWMFFGTGILSFLIFGCAYFTAIKLTSMAVAAMLLYTSPVFIMLMAAVIFKEKITSKKIISIILCILGCVLISLSDGGISASKRGVFFGLLSGFCYALYSIFGRIAAKRYSSITITAYTFLFASCGSIFAADIPAAKEIVFSHLELIPTLSLFSLVSAVFPYILYTGGLKYTPAAKAGVIACVEPVVAAASGVILFGDSLNAAVILGACLILSAIFVQNKN